MDRLEKAVRSFREAMPALAEAFGEDEVRASVKSVVGKEVDRDLALSAMSGDMDDQGIRLMVEVACDLRDRLL